MVQYGLTVYTHPRVSHRARDIATLVGRLLDLGEVYFGIHNVDRSYRADWRAEVWDQFTFGELALIEALSDMDCINRGQIKRMVRTLGAILFKPPDELEYDEVGALIRCLYGRDSDFHPGAIVHPLAFRLGIDNDEMLGHLKQEGGAK